jgi:hypothetical protein
MIAPSSIKVPRWHIKLAHTVGLRNTVISLVQVKPGLSTPHSYLAPDTTDELLNHFLPQNTDVKKDAGK